MGLEIYFNSERPNVKAGIWSFTIKPVKQELGQMPIHAVAYGRTRDEAERNANMIVAGAALFKALTVANDSFGSQAWSDVRELMETALAKAR